jgi:arylsulfatase
MKSLPHILLLVTDQFRHDAFSPITTPNLYQFASRHNVTMFENAYASTPTCTPARAGLLTGKSPWNHGMLSYGRYTDCDKYPTTLPHMLSQLANYSTTAVGKNHFGPTNTQGFQDVFLYDGLSEQFDTYDEFFKNATLPGINPLATCDLGWNDWQSCPYLYEEYLHPTAWTTRTALHYLDEYFGSPTKKDDEDDGSGKDHEDAHPQPLFLKVSYHRPHSPYDPPRRLLNKYLEGGDKFNISQLDRFVNNSSWDVQYQNTTQMDPSAWYGDPGIESARHSRAGYLANVEFVDERMGQLLDWMERNDHNVKMKDFLVLWTSDHGDMNGDHNMWRKGYPWEASSHIAMLAKLPESSSSSSNMTAMSLSTSSTAMVENRDIAPTIYDVVGILDQVKARDPAMNGQSLLPLLTGSVEHVRTWLDLEHGAVYNATIHWNALVGYLDHSAEIDSTKCDCCGTWKYIFNAFDASEQLFCLASDRNETHDLAALSSCQDVLSMWRQRMVQQFEEEGRGPDWVRDGVLQARKKSTVFGPNYPCLAEERDIHYTEMLAF